MIAVAQGLALPLFAAGFAAWCIWRDGWPSARRAGARSGYTPEYAKARTDPSHRRDA